MVRVVHVSGMYVNNMFKRFHAHEQVKAMEGWHEEVYQRVVIRQQKREARQRQITSTLEAKYNQKLDQIESQIQEVR